MSSWFQSRRQEQSHLSSISPPSNGQAVNAGRTAYISTNAVEQKSFYANAPAGSQHATRLQKLALQQQPEYRPPPEFKDPTKRLEHKIQKGITAQGELPPGYIDNSGPSAGVSLSRDSRESRDQTARCPECEPNGTYGTSDQSYVGSQVIPPQRTDPQPISVNRYERNGTIAYHKKGKGGELLISAPTGSHEAQSMDNAASRLGATKASTTSVSQAGFIEGEERTHKLVRGSRGTSKGSKSGRSRAW